MKDKEKLIKTLKKYAMQIKACLVITAIIICGIIYTGISASNHKTETNLTSVDNSLDTSKDVVEDVKLYVYICGCVSNPGVYQCSEDARIFEIIEMAGGFTDDADISANNLAAGVKDGQKIIIPSLNNVDIQNSESPSGGGLININTATKEQLMTLPGIGESKANDIIEYRKSNNGFNAIEDIMNISGIKTAAFSKIKDMITV